MLDAPRAIAGRFMTTGPGVDGPVGTVLPANDLQGGAPVRVLLVADAVLSSPAVADRALREWKQLAKVASPKVIRVLDQGRLDDGKIFVASEPSRGVSLEELVQKEGALAIDRVRSIVAQVGEALTEAQKVGVIHRDVSPRTIFVAGDEATIGDFGVAEVVSDKVFGSPTYLSPEQAEGKPVDQRSNIYSLGAVLYYMLTGAPPFEGDTDSLLAQHISATPATPSSRRQGLPAELDRIVMKALEKSGGRRHLTLRQLITEVEAVSAGGSVVRGAELGHATTLNTEGSAAPRTMSGAATVFGMPAPVITRSVTAKTEETPVMVKQGRTVMAEAPRVTAPKAAEPPVAAAKTMMAEAPVIAAATKPTPAPIPVAAPVIAAPVAAKPAAAAPAAAAKKGFRETAWFKKGELEEELAKAQAANMSEDPLAPTGTTGVHVAVDEAGINVTSQDSKRLSLKTGATQMMQAIKIGTGGSPAMPGERMDESEMIAEIDRSRRWFMIAGVIVVVAIIGLVAMLFTRKAEPTEAPKHSSEPPAATASVAAAVPAPSPPAEAKKGDAPAAAGTAAAVAPGEKQADAADGQAAILAEADAAIAKESYPLAVDALVRASHAGGDQAKVHAIAASLQKTLTANALKAKKKKDHAGEVEAKTLLAKVHALAPAPAAPAKKSKVASRRR